MKAASLLILVLSALSACNGCFRRVGTRTTPDSVRGGPGLEAVAGPRFTTIRVDVRTERVELFLRDDAGRTFNRFDRLKSWLASRNKRLRFAMNAGMFEPNYLPA